MPPDLLLAAFALILLANAVLVAVSLQAMRRSRDDASAPVPALAPSTVRDVAHPVEGPARPIGGSAMSDEVARAVRARRRILGAPPEDRGRADRGGADRGGLTGDARPSGLPASVPVRAVERTRRSRSVVLSAASGPRPRVAGVPGAAPSAADRDPPLTPAAAIEPPATPAAGPPIAESRARATAGPASKRGRRRFSLPPLDDDHEKVSRSIESFLTGGDAPGPPADPVGSGPRGAAAETAPTTVALVAVCGPAGDPTLGSAAGDVTSGTAALVGARAVVERTLRAAARGTDSVETDDAGRFRIVLTGAGELAARAYLRRIRATVEPLLEASDDPLRLVTATATVLDEPLAVAAGTAERRLTAAIARSAERAAPPAGDGHDEEDDDGEDEPEPRAAGD